MYGLHHVHVVLKENEENIDPPGTWVTDGGETDQTWVLCKSSKYL